jgi:hypothetical protein
MGTLELSKGNVKRKFIPISAFIKKSKNSHIENLKMYLDLLEKQKQSKSKSRRWKETINIRADGNWKNYTESRNKELVLRKDK